MVERDRRWKSEETSVEIRRRGGVERWESEKVVAWLFQARLPLYSSRMGHRTATTKS